MNSTERERTIQRILVALDASPQSLAALEAAAELAERIGAEVVGLFVEDINLMRLAEMPFVQMVDPLSAALRPLETRHVEGQFRMQAGRARRALQRIAERTQVRWSFRVVRGHVTSEVVAASSEADLIILGRSGWTPAGQRRLGSTAQTVVSRASCLTLVLREGGCMGLPVQVLYDGSELAGRALSAAAQLVQERDCKLTVLIPAEGEDAAGRLRRQALEWLQAQGVEADTRVFIGPDVQRLVDLIRAGGRGVLVLPASSALLKEESLQDLMDRTECPVLVVR